MVARARSAFARAGALPRSLAAGVLSLLLATALLGPVAHAEAPSSVALAATTAPVPELLPVTVRELRFLNAVPEPVGSTSPAWTRPGFDDRAWSPAPSTPSADRGLGPWLPAPRLPSPTPPPPVLSVPFGEGQALQLRVLFDAPGGATWRALEIRAAYADGIALFLNGKEVARSGTGSVATDGARAPFSHGSDPEAFYVPLGPGALRPEGNVLAVEVWPGPGSRGPTPRSPALGALTLGATTAVRIVRGPYWTKPRADAATLRWETDLATTGEVTLERAGKRERHTTPKGTRHSVAFNRLAHGAATYTVRVKSAGAGEVLTAPERAPSFPSPSQPFSFVVYGDMRTPGHEAHAAVVAAVLKEAPSLVLNTGDLVAIGSEEGTWQRYFAITRPLGVSTVVAPALGNHDVARAGIGARKTWDLFGFDPPPHEVYTTSFDVAGVHFVLLDTNHVDEGQRAWLADDLARARRHKARAILAFCHAGPFAHGVHGSDGTVARVLAPTLAAAHVDMLFSGHDHLYERGEGATSAGPLPFMVTGGGGAPLYDPSCRMASDPTTLPGEKPLCPKWVASVAKTYHYVTVAVTEHEITYCPKTPDGAPVEPCFTRRLSGR